MRKIILKSVAASLSISLFITNVALVHAAETNLWTEQHQSQQPSQPSNSVGAAGSFGLVLLHQISAGTTVK